MNLLHTLVPLALAGLGFLAAGDPPIHETSQPQVAAEDLVAPGLVHWHADRAAALAAAKESGRPVLIFQMLGRLDERFC